MQKLSKSQKYFKKAILYFFEQSEQTPTDEQVVLLHNYLEYLRNNNYRQTLPQVEFELSTEKELTLAQAFKEGTQVHTVHAEVVLIALQNELENVNKQLEHHKHKHNILRDTLLSKIKLLESKTKDRYSEIEKLRVAYNAGVASVQLIERKPLSPELQPYLAVEKKMNFNTWANKIYKYGKGQLKIKRAKVRVNHLNNGPEEGMPLPRFAGEAQPANARRVGRRLQIN